MFTLIQLEVEINLQKKKLNPFEYLGITFSNNGKEATLWEKTQNEWMQYFEIDGDSSYAVDVNQSYSGKGFNLTHWFSVYEWVSDDGYNNFHEWVGEYFFFGDINMNENKRAHLSMIQVIINRLSQNSFFVKGWSITLVSAMFALAVQDANIIFIYLAYFPPIMFWILDSYYLWQEKLYRSLYDHVRIANEDDVNFSLDASTFQDSNPGWMDTLGSKTILLFHAPLLLVILFVTIVVSFY